MRPTWATIADKLFDPLREAAEAALCARSGVHEARRAQHGIDHPQAAYLALFHFLQSLHTSQFASVRGFYSVAVGLLRHCVESLSIVELGLSDHPDAARKQKQWEDGMQLGEVRQWLEVNLWPQYGTGLWNEPWAEYFGNLARAVQPYAHYSRQLLEWQFSVMPASEPLAMQESESLRLTVGVGLPDPVKVSRISLFQALLGWTLGRILTANGRLDQPEIVADLSKWGSALSSSEFFFKSKNWGDELLSTVVFHERYPV